MGRDFKHYQKKKVYLKSEREVEMRQNLVALTFGFLLLVLAILI